MAMTNPTDAAADGATEAARSRNEIPARCMSKYKKMGMITKTPGTKTRERQTR